MLSVILTSKNDQMFYGIGITLMLKDKYLYLSLGFESRASQAASSKATTKEVLYDLISPAQKSHLGKIPCSKLLLRPKILQKLTR